MALFAGKENRTVRQEDKLNQWMVSHGLSGMKPEYAETLKSLAGIETGIALQRLGSNSVDIIKEYLYIVKEQNWMLIRLLNDIAQK